MNSHEAQLLNEAINLNKFNINNCNEESKNNTIPIDNNFNLNSNYIKFKIIRMVLSSNYGHNNSIGLTGLEFYDINNKLINIETAETIGALPKDLHTIFNDPNDNRIFENIFNGENNIEIQPSRKSEVFLCQKSKSTTQTDSLLFQACR